MSQFFYSPPLPFSPPLPPPPPPPPSPSLQFSPLPPPSSSPSPNPNPTTNVIERIYSYQPEQTVLTLNNSHKFIDCLEQVHSFIDCCHDQFDPSRMSSLFKSNKGVTDELRDLIWYFSFGNTQSNQFETNDYIYYKTNNIHKLAEALTRTPSNNHNFSIKPPNGIKTVCDYVLPDLIEQPWKNAASPNPHQNQFVTYKFYEYTPQNSAQAGTELLNFIGSVNSAYILDCGKRQFHENFTNNSAQGISIFSGIIDSSTVNDPVPNKGFENWNPAVKNKLQFLIPFIAIPELETIHMYCTYSLFGDPSNTNPSYDKLFLAFLFDRDVTSIPNFYKNTPQYNIAKIKELFPLQFKEVRSIDIPDLTNVTNYLAGPKVGCFLSLANTFGITSNPCYNYENITTELYNKFTSFPKATYDQDKFNQIFQIRFKHIGDKTRLIDAVIMNSLSVEDNKISLCHTGTIDTFSNRYALLGNLYTITPIKGSNLFVNDNKVITQTQLDAIKTATDAAKDQFFLEQKALFELIKKSDIERCINIINQIILIIQNTFRKDNRILIKREKKLGRLSGLTTDYWDVKVAREPQQKKFVINAYNAQDLQLIEAMEIILVDITLSFAEQKYAEQLYAEQQNAEQQNAEHQGADLFTYFANENRPLDKEATLYDKPLKIYLDILRLLNLFSVCGVVFFEGNLLAPTKQIMFIANSIAKSGFTLRNSVKDPNNPNPNQIGGNPFVVITDFDMIQKSYQKIFDEPTRYFNNDKYITNDENMVDVIMDIYSIHFYNKNRMVPTIQIDNKWSNLLKKNLATENLKQNIYGILTGEDDDDLQSSFSKYTVITGENLDVNLDVSDIISDLNKYQTSLENEHDQNNTLRKKGRNFVRSKNPTSQRSSDRAKQLRSLSIRERRRTSKPWFGGNHRTKKIGKKKRRRTRAVRKGGHHRLTRRKTAKNRKK